MEKPKLVLIFALWLAIINVVSYMLSYALLPVYVWYINGLVGWFEAILFGFGGILLAFGALFGTFIGYIMFYTPFGYAKKRDTTGKDESDNKFTDTGLPLILLGLFIIIESVIIALTVAG